MPAKSESQQRLMGMVYAYKKGELDMSKLNKSLQKKIRDIAEGMTEEEAKDFASTKHKDIKNEGTDMEDVMSENNEIPKIDLDEMTELARKLNPEILMEAEDNEDEDEGATEETPEEETSETSESSSEEKKIKNYLIEKYSVEEMKGVLEDNYSKEEEDFEGLDEDGIATLLTQEVIDEYETGVWSDAVDDLGAYNILLFEEEVDTPTSVEESSWGYGYEAWIGQNESYLIFKDEDEARNEAEASVAQDLEEEPSMFTQDWLKQFYSMSDTDRRVYANEEADSYLSDIKEEDDGERIIEEAGEVDDEITEAYEELQEKYEDDEIDQEEYDKQKEDLIDKAFNTLNDHMVDYIYERLSDPYKYFVEDQGMYSREDFFKNFSGMHLDVEKASKNAVEVDGIAHFLARYDGEEMNIGDLYVYRNN